MSNTILSIERIKTPEIGLDKCTVGNIQILDINFDKLGKAIKKAESKFEECPNDKKKKLGVTLQKNSEKDAYYILNGKKKFSYLRIIDNNKFMEIMAGVKINKGEIQKYCKMQICVKNYRKSNLHSLTCAEFKDCLDKAAEHLEKEYGVIVNMSNAQFTEMEINTTMPLNDTFNKYSNCWLMFVRNVPSARFNKYSINKKNNVTYNTFYEALQEQNRDILQTLYVGNDSIELKIYDKGKQLNNVVTSSFTVRIEFTISTTSKIKNLFNTREVSAFSDEILRNFFKEEMEKDIFEPYEKWKKKNQKDLYKELDRRYKESESNEWIQDFLRRARELSEVNNVSLVFDIEHLYEPLGKVVNNPSRTMSRLKKEALKFENDMLGNEAKVQEIKDKIMSL